MHAWEMWKWRSAENIRTSLGTCNSLLDIQNERPEFTFASTLDKGYSYMLFRKGQRPEWDDKMNGARWATYHELSVGKDLETMLNDSFGIYSEEICGCQIDIRRMNCRIALWTFDKYNRDAYTQIGVVVQEAVSPSNDWKYEDHFENHHYKSSYKVKPILTLTMRPIQPAAM